MWFSLLRNVGPILVFKSESEWVEKYRLTPLTPSRLGVDFLVESTQKGNFWQFLELIYLIIALILNSANDFSILVNSKLVL